MFCVPPCVGCQEAGNCPKDGYRPPARPVKRRPPPPAAREAIRERGAAAYIHLPCGHMTTVEVQEAFSIWRPKNKAFYCETCFKWVKRLPRAKSPSLPLEPLF